MKDLSKISDILTDSVFSKKSCAYSVKKAVAFGFWKDVCGSRFANFSIPYDIKGQTLFVAVKNPQVMQELIFNKTALLSKLRNYFLPLNIKIEEIRYDYKKWNSLTSSVYLEGNEAPEAILEDELEEVSLTPFEQKEIAAATDTISNLSFLTGELREKYSKNMINSIKARKIIKRGSNFDK